MKKKPILQSCLGISIEKALGLIESHLPKGQMVAVGMSGGVDSSVTAALLKQLGYDVIGLFMKNWDEGPDCPAEKDSQDVALVAKKIDIPFYTINFTKEYKEAIFESFLSDLKKGLTPNPDILCNREVKFKKLLEKALSLGASGLATGHYAKNRAQDCNHFFLERAFDSSKDQTYFLYTATQESLSKTLFPLANFKKCDIRHLASLFDLPVADKKDSTGICFIGERNFTEFLTPYLGYSPGPMLSVEGQPVGSHIGLAYYTIGQRKGLKIGGRGDAWFVVDKDVKKNILYVAQGEHHPALYASSLLAKDAHWISGSSPSFPKTCTAKIRYRQPDQQCTIEQQGSLLKVSFSEPQRAITPQQSIVFYDGHICLGGAFIVKKMPFSCL